MKTQLLEETLERVREIGRTAPNANHRGVEVRLCHNLVTGQRWVRSKGVETYALEVDFDTEPLERANWFFIKKSQVIF